ncbi:hypothetical protein HYE82_03680 [Streptomyces sp. BR123]|uniref:hypothetical protein n=1 Tax=Streptomyces sp. BR123 TaxID=2749828 RepID=UPI0015C4DFA3|nr:hypothetical protein [Streptomyces sp. BR123]NXY93523.1 hypothetical protein [Streptomyces sp. BR123]
MRPARFHQFAIDTLPKAPDVQAVEDGAEAGRPYSLHVTFTNGSQVWVGITGALAPGEKHTTDEQPVHADAPAEVPYPPLFNGGNVTPVSAAAYLAAAVANTGNTEILTAEPYSDDAQNPGFGVTFHNGAKAFCLFTHTGRAGQTRGSRAYDLQGAF